MQERLAALSFEAAADMPEDSAALAGRNGSVSRVANGRTRRAGASRAKSRKGQVDSKDQHNAHMNEEPLLIA